MCGWHFILKSKKKNIYYLLHKENEFSYFYLICFAFVTLMLKTIIVITVITALQFILLKTVIWFINTMYYYYLFIYYVSIQFSKYNHNL